MDIVNEFYVDWFNWAEARVPQLVTENPVLLISFGADLAAIIRDDVMLLRGLTSTVHGNVFESAIRVFRWLQSHPDALKPQREAMRAMRMKYGEAKK